MYGQMNEYRDLDERGGTRVGGKDYRRVKTLQKEKQEVDEATPKDDEGDSVISGGAPPVMEGEEEEEEEEVDLDASMEDLDESDEEEQEEEDPSPMLAS